MPPALSEGSEMKAQVNLTVEDQSSTQKWIAVGTVAMNKLIDEVNIEMKSKSELTYVEHYRQYCRFMLARDDKDFLPTRHYD